MAAETDRPSISLNLVYRPVKFLAYCPALGFTERIRGGHHIFSKPGVPEILNLQPRGAVAKPYQVKQVRAVIVRYKLAEGAE
jgi:hypothetical protein